MANATPQSGSCPLAEENHSVLLQQLFMLACIHLYTWAAFVSLAQYQVSRHGCAVCLMEMLCRKRPCVLNMCTSVMGYSWVPLGVSVCLIRLSSCDCKQTCEYSEMEEIPETGVPAWYCIYYRTRKGGMMHAYCRAMGHYGVSALQRWNTEHVFIICWQQQLEDVLPWPSQFIWDIISCCLRWMLLFGSESTQGSAD